MCPHWKHSIKTKQIQNKYTKDKKIDHEREIQVRSKPLHTKWKQTNKALLI